MSAEPAARMPVKVIDSWALMAWLKDQQPASERVEALWGKARAREVRLVINVVNLGEVYYLTAKAKGIESAEMVLEQLGAMPLEVRPAPNGVVFEAARIKAEFSVSYADAFAAATAIRERAPLVTGDPELRMLARRRLLHLEWIGSRGSRVE